MSQKLKRSRSRRSRSRSQSRRHGTPSKRSKNARIGRVRKLRGGKTPTGWQKVYKNLETGEISGASEIPPTPATQNSTWGSVVPPSRNAQPWLVSSPPLTSTVPPSSFWGPNGEGW